MRSGSRGLLPSGRFVCAGLPATVSTGRVAVTNAPLPTRPYTALPAPTRERRRADSRRRPVARRRPARQYIAVRNFLAGGRSSSLARLEGCLRGPRESRARNLALRGRPVER